MRNRFAVFIIIVTILFGSINYYIGLRGLQWLRAISPFPVNGWAYWLPFLLLSFSFIIGRFSRRLFPRGFADALSVVGSYWLPIWIYLLLITILLDVVRALNAWIGFIPAALAGDIQLGRISGEAVLVLLLAIVLYGVWRARHPVVVRYEIAVPKRAGKHSELNVVLVSDTHWGTINRLPRLRSMIQMVNALKPDLILLAGDLIDDDLQPFIEMNMAKELRQLKAKLGVFSVLGNHDVRSGASTEFRRQMERAGIQLLVDDWAKVDDSLYVIGRDDISGKAFGGVARKSLAELLKEVDKRLPLILMDHQPAHLEEAQHAGIDLQVSGHTHRGQMFPFNYVTRKVFEVDWGYLAKAGLHVVVSLGFGTWGPPIRIGNRPEVVSIRVRFT